MFTRPRGAVRPVHSLCALLMLSLPGFVAGQKTTPLPKPAIAVPALPPGLVILAGGAGDALSYSLHNDVVAITLLTGAETPHSGEDIARAIKNNIFTGRQDIPLAVFIYQEPAPGKGDIAMGVFIRGHLFRDDYTEKDILDAKGLRDCAGQIVNKFRNPARRVDKKDALSGDW